MRRRGTLAQPGPAGEPGHRARAAGRLHRRPARLLQGTEYQGCGFAHRTIDGEPREDETQTLSLSIHNRTFTLAGFSPRISLIREERDTNAQALDYDSNRPNSPS